MKLIIIKNKFGFLSKEEVEVKDEQEARGIVEKKIDEMYRGMSCGVQQV